MLENDYRHRERETLLDTVKSMEGGIVSQSDAPLDRKLTKGTPHSERRFEVRSMAVVDRQSCVYTLLTS